MTNEDEDDAMGEVEREPVEKTPLGTGAEIEAGAEVVDAIDAPEEIADGSLDPSDAGRGEEERRDAMARVKLYRLNDSGHWDDKGTGFASCEYMEVRRRFDEKETLKTDGEYFCFETLAEIEFGGIGRHVGAESGTVVGACDFSRRRLLFQARGRDNYYLDGQRVWYGYSAEFSRGNGL